MLEISFKRNKLEDDDEFSQIELTNKSGDHEELFKIIAAHAYVNEKRTIPFMMLYDKNKISLSSEITVLLKESDVDKFIGEFSLYADEYEKSKGKE